MAWAERISSRGWRARYRDGEGQIHTAGYASTERKALLLGQGQEASIRAGTWFDPNAGKVTFADYFEKQWVGNRVGEVNTISMYWSHYRTALKPAFGDMQLRRILPSTVQGWVAQMQRDGVTPGTIKARVKALQAILAAKKGASALRDKLIQFNPVAGVELPYAPEPEVEIYTPDESDALLAAMDPWWRALPLFALEAGARWGEVMGVRVEDFTFGMRSVTLRRTIVENSTANTGTGTPFMWKEYPKGKRPRKVALSREASTAVTELIAARGLGPEDRLFSMPDKTLPPNWHPPLTLEWTPRRTDAWPEGLPIARAHFRKYVWLHAISTAEVPVRTFHDLRASHISWLLAGGADLPTVMERVGHTQFQTTRRYTAVLEEADDRALEALSSIRARYSG